RGSAFYTNSDTEDKPCAVRNRGSRHMNNTPNTSTATAKTKIEVTKPTAAVASALAEHAEAIRLLGKRVVADVIEIGRRLTECKRIARHGNWLPWLEREFGWSVSTAENYINLHKLSTEFPTVGNLDIDLRS